MAGQWFDPSLYAWIPGTVYACVCGLMGALVGVLASRGRARNFVIRAWYTLLALGVVFLAVGLAALVNGQPWGVWYALLLPGVIGTIVVGANTFTVRKAYRLAEERRLAAKDLL